MTLLSYKPLLLTENPKNVLVICFGTGLTAGAAGAYPGIDLVDAVDISPGVFRAGKFFKETNHNVLNNPKVNKIIQDGRQHLLTTSTKYDVITAEPPPPSSAGTVNLYAKEYYELTKQALKPGGIVSQWIPLHSQAENHIYQHFRTFLESFPYAMAWYPSPRELILIGSNHPININLQDIEERLQNPVIKKIMSDIDFGTPYSFLGSIWYLKNELKSMGSSQRIISDNNPSLEFFLNDARDISEDGITRITESRTSFEDTFEKISQSSYFLSKEKKATFKKNWDSRLKAESAEVHYNLGIAVMNKGNTSEAISHYKKAIELNPDLAQAHNNLGSALIHKGNTSEAIVHYKTTIKLKPDYADAHFNLGSALLNQGNTSEAIVHYKKAIELHPDLAQAHNNLGNVLIKKGNTNEAIFHYKRAIELNPDDYQVHYNLGNTLLNQGNTSEAIVHYKKAIELHPDLAQAHNNLGNALIKKGNTNEAIFHYKRAIEHNHDFAEAHNNLGVVMMKKGNTSEAIVHYKSAIELKPDYAYAHNNLGNALKKKGNTSEAILYYKKAIELKPDYADAHYNLGVAMHRQGMIEEAITYYKEAIRIQPDLAAARRNLEKALIQSTTVDF